MDHDRTQKNLTRLYPLLTVEEKDELLQSMIIAALRDSATVPNILEAYASAKDFQLLTEYQEMGKEVP